MPTSNARPRRTAQQTRAEILDAAERLLAANGPEAVRLQEVAGEVGISHPAILHHFGSREGLMRSLSSRAIETLHEDLVTALLGTRERADPAELLRRIATTLGDRGHARLLAWTLLSGRSGDEAEDEDERHDLELLVKALHVRRRRERDVTEQDSRFIVLLVASAMLGDALFGEALRDRTALEGDDLAGARYRDWLAALLADLSHRA